MISTVAGCLAGSTVGVSDGDGVTVGVCVAEEEGLGLSVGLPKFGYKTEQPEVVANDKTRTSPIRRFFISLD
jgi:hypothetical protein